MKDNGLNSLVCAKSIKDNASKPVNIFHLKHRELRDIGLFKREWVVTENGITIDKLDQRPFSTQFSFTRFVVPHLARYYGTRLFDPCIFVDSDFVFLSDIYNLLNEIDVDSKPVHVVKHDYQSPNVIKMDNQVQSNYNKKLWSSFIVFNMKDPKCAPSVEEINTKDGNWLHSFSWIGKDSDIGEINEGWNYIPNHSNKRVKEKNIRAIHYTEGSPLLKSNCRFAEVYNSVLREVLSEASVNLEILSCA